MSTSEETKVIADAFIVSLYPEAADIIDTMDELATKGRLVYNIIVDDVDHAPALVADLETQIAEYYVVTTPAVLYTEAEVDALVATNDSGVAWIAAGRPTIGSIKTAEVLEPTATPAGYVVTKSGVQLTISSTGTSGVTTTC